MQKKRKKNTKNAMSRNIRSLRKAMGFAAQEKFADQIGIGTRTLASWESGEIDPSHNRVLDMLKICYQTAPEEVKAHFSSDEWHYIVAINGVLNGLSEETYRKKFEEAQAQIIALQKELLRLKKGG
jgi:DNA-binding transcriptional regulator YiaG